MNRSWRLETKPTYADFVTSIRSERGERPLTQQSLETLAVVALRQPVTTDDVTAIRGVDSTATIETLRQRKFIAKVAQQRGKAIHWRTTQTFLDLFGLRNMDDLYRDYRDSKIERIFGPVYGIADSRNNTVQNDS
jgi:segregation and condensation protein B